MNVVGLLFSWPSWCGVNKNIPPWCQLWGEQLWWLQLPQFDAPSVHSVRKHSQTKAVLCFAWIHKCPWASEVKNLWSALGKWLGQGRMLGCVCHVCLGFKCAGTWSAQLWCCHPPAGVDASMDFTGSSVLPAVWHLAYARFVLCLCSFCLFCISNLCPRIFITACSLKVGASGCPLESHHLLQDFQYVLESCTHKHAWSEPII